MDAKKSITLLNKAVADELQAVHQYMYWHFHLDDQGFAPLSMMLKRIAIQEMGHVEILADRILFLKGDVEMVAAGPVEKITEAQDILAKAAEMEQAGVQSYNQAALECSQNADAVSKQLFEQLVQDEEIHFDEFDKQLDNIKRFGPSYLAFRRSSTCRPSRPSPAAAASRSPPPSCTSPRRRSATRSRGSSRSSACGCSSAARTASG